MLLAIDIGNSNIVIGIIYGDKILTQFRIATDYTKTAEQYALEIKNLLVMQKIAISEIFDCIISSVVPPVFYSVLAAVKILTKKTPMVVKSSMKINLKICRENPSSLGSDLIVTAVAAIDKYLPPLIIIDMGTATTISVIEKGNLYLGSVIIPGVKISAQALFDCAAQLSEIQLEKPTQIIGRNTTESMQSGIIFGSASMLDGMIKLI